MKKTTILLAAITLFLTSCTYRIQQLVELGQYDQAMELAGRKMAGKKKKKTKDIQLLEEAFAKHQARDLEQIRYLKLRDTRVHSPAILDIYRKIRGRQNKVAALLPLVSKDGYEGHFEFVDVSAEIVSAAQNAAAYHYDNAQELITQARGGSKHAAREAYKQLSEVRKYDKDYKDTYMLKDEAYRLGQRRVFVKILNSDDHFIAREFDHVLADLNAAKLNSTWTKYYTAKPAAELDREVVMQILDIDFSPEREHVERHVDTKTIRDGWDYVIDRHGNVKKDSLGNDIKTERYIEVQSRVKEVHRTKSAFMSGRLDFFHPMTGELLDTKEITVETVFEDLAVSFKGDKRALCKKCAPRLRERPLPFPSDFEMGMEATALLKAKLTKHMKQGLG